MTFPRNILFKKIKLTAAGTTTVPGGGQTGTVYLCAAYLFVATAGLTLVMQDKDPSGVSVLYNPGAPAVTTAPISILTGFNLIPMLGGIDIIATGSGAATLWLVYAAN